MAVANTLAYYVTATITAVKSFIVQAPGGIASIICALKINFCSTNVIRCFFVKNTFGPALSYGHHELNLFKASVCYCQSRLL